MRDYCNCREYPISILSVSFLKEDYCLLEAEEYLIRNISRDYISVVEDACFFTFTITRRLRLESEGRISYNARGNIILEYEMLGEEL